MMTPRKLIDYVAAEPFRTFRINMASGKNYVVRHPENILITRSSAKVFLPSDESAGEERWYDVSLLLMESVEPLDVPAGKDGNA